MKAKVLRRAERERHESRERTPTYDNRRARYEYEIMESLEAGIVLTGTEIKSIRAGDAAIDQAYARLREGELYLFNASILPYKQGTYLNHEPGRPRKLLLHRKQIERIAGRVAEKGLTIVPLRMYFTRGIVKLQIGVARGKKLWDKRRVSADRDVQRELARALKR